MSTSNAQRYEDRPPAWMPRALKSATSLINRLLGPPDWLRSGCAITAVLADAPTPALWLARLAPAPYCLGDAAPGGPVEPLVRQLVAARAGRVADCWLSLVVERNSAAPERCDIGWVYALLQAAADHRLRVLDVVVTDPDGSRLVCANAPVLTLIPGEPRRWPAIRHAVDVDPQTCLAPYGKTAFGHWSLPRGCPAAPDHIDLRD
jgi:hypothetical protein